MQSIKQRNQPEQLNRQALTPAAQGIRRVPWRVWFIFKAKMDAKQEKRGGPREASKAAPGKLRKKAPIRLPEDLTEQGKEAAKAAGITFTALVERAIRRELASPVENTKE